MIDQRAEIVNGLGLHARPAAQFVKLAATFASSIEIECDGERANGKSIMGVMMLAAECGASVHLYIDGPDEEAAAAALMGLIERGFGEK
ncbi:MAG: HPr family phosphocarrier protein [Gemmatimonadales bacterium]